MKKIIDFSPDLILFTYLVDYKSYTALAERLEINKSVISKRIKNLEQQLGVQLLIRNTRNLKLTDAGELLYDRCHPMQRDFQNLYSELSDINQSDGGTLRISAPSSFAQECLTPLIVKFTKMYPKIRCKIMSGRSYQSMVKHRIDLGFHLGPLPDSNLRARKISTSRFVACASPNFIKQNPPIEHPRQLEKLNCLRFIQGKHLNQWSFVSPEGESISVDVNGNFHSTSSLLLVTAASDDLGVIMLPDYQLKQALQSGRLVQLLPEYDTKRIDIYVLYNNTVHLPHRTRLLLDFLVCNFEASSYPKQLAVV